MTDDELEEAREAACADHLSRGAPSSENPYYHLTCWARTPEPTGITWVKKSTAGCRLPKGHSAPHSASLYLRITWEDE
jgi:hypothetical protein